MVDHTQGIYDILNNLTGYSGGWFPNTNNLNEINAALPKFLVVPKTGIDNEDHWYIEQYAIHIKAATEASLRTVINKMFDHSSSRPGGFVPSGSYATAAHPFYIMFVAQNSNQTLLGKNNWEALLDLNAHYEVQAT